MPSTASSADPIAAAVAAVESPSLRDLMERLAPALPDRPTYRDYPTALRASLRHIDDDLPELRDGRPRRIVEVGPGIGAFMVAARALGHAAVGYDVYVPAYAEITRALRLDVRHGGFRRILDLVLSPDGGRRVAIELGAEGPRSLDLVHLRGSLDAVIGEPDAVEVTIVRLMEYCSLALARGGVLWIGHNADALRAPILTALRRHHGPLRIETDTEAVTRMRRP